MLFKVTTTKHQGSALLFACEDNPQVASGLSSKMVSDAIMVTSHKITHWCVNKTMTSYFLRNLLKGFYISKVPLVQVITPINDDPSRSCIYAASGLNESYHLFLDIYDNVRSHYGTQLSRSVKIETLSDSSLTLKPKCHFDEFFVTGGTETCQNCNFQCSQW